LDIWIRERIAQDAADSSFETECAAYELLKDFQGKSVPQIFGTVTLDSTAHPDHVGFNIRGLLMEYIGGICLEKIGRKAARKVPRYVGEDALQIFQRLPALGLLHNDVHLHKLILRKSDQRVFLIDFSIATIRNLDPRFKENEAWDDWVKRTGDARWIENRLDQKGLRERTPFEPIRDPEGDYYSFKEALRKCRLKWIQKYYIWNRNVPDGTGKEEPPYLLNRYAVQERERKLEKYRLERYNS
jgi:hypothetical protein